MTSSLVVSESLRVEVPVAFCPHTATATAATAAAAAVVLPTSGCEGRHPLEQGHQLAPGGTLRARTRPDLLRELSRSLDGPSSRVGGFR